MQGVKYYGWLSKINVRFSHGYGLWRYSYPAPLCAQKCTIMKNSVCTLNVNIAEATAGLDKMEEKIM